MVNREQIKNDPRFYVDDFNLNRIYRDRITSYTIVDVCVGDILRSLGRKITTLYETDVYKFLNKSEGSLDAYQKYCDGIGMSRRSIASYELLIKKIKDEGYDISKGAIFINQNNIILEGQHRCCILLKFFGPSYKISVVRLNYREKVFRPRFWVRLFVANIKKLIFNRRYES